MISESSSTNGELFTLIGDSSCKRGIFPMEIPSERARFDKLYSSQGESIETYD